MEFIARFHDKNTLSEVTGLLRSKGIPTYVKPMESRSMGWQAALFVCLSDQAEDARRIIKDPRHEPARRVDAHAFEDALEVEDTTLIAKWATVTAVIVVAAFAGLVWLVRSLGG